jgi:hypothetical protein
VSVKGNSKGSSDPSNSRNSVNSEFEENSNLIPDIGCPTPGVA